MRQLVLGHSTSPPDFSTIQLLLTQPQFDANNTTTFNLACSSLTDAVVASAGRYEPMAQIVIGSLAQIVNILFMNVRVSQSSSAFLYSVELNASQLKPLVSTLNLLNVLVISLPSFVMNLLKPTDCPHFSKQSVQ